MSDLQEIEDADLSSCNAPKPSQYLVSLCMYCGNGRWLAAQRRLPRMITELTVLIGRTREVIDNPAYVRL
jgi:hypothetical protein